MWTTNNRARYDRSFLRYPSDLTDDEWALVEPLIPPAKRGGDKRTVIMREVVNGLMSHRLVAEVVGVFENGEPRHQPRRQRRLAGAILVNLAEFLFQKSPVDRPRQLRQRMIHVDDLIEPRTKHILLAGLSSLPWPHQILHASLPPAENHGSRFEGIPIANLQENRCGSCNFRQVQLQEFRRFLFPIKRFRIFHGRLNKMIPDYQSLMLPLLRCAEDGKEHRFGELLESLAKQFGLTEAETTQLLPSGK